MLHKGESGDRMEAYLLSCLTAFCYAADDPFSLVSIIFSDTYFMQTPLFHDHSGSRSINALSFATQFKTGLHLVNAGIPGDPDSQVLKLSMKLSSKSFLGMNGDRLLVAIPRDLLLKSYSGILIL